MSGGLDTFGLSVGEILAYVLEGIKQLSQSAWFHRSVLLSHMFKHQDENITQRQRRKKTGKLVLNRLMSLSRRIESKRIESTRREKCLKIANEDSFDVYDVLVVSNFSIGSLQVDIAMVANTLQLPQGWPTLLPGRLTLANRSQHQQAVTFECSRNLTQPWIELPSTTQCQRHTTLYQADTALCHIR
jgi:hypothetical protein